MQNLSGQTIKGYELHEQIGSGGFGAVYRAYQPSVKREVAIKAILPEHASSPDFVKRFEVEAQLIARMEHPYIVPLYDFWQDAQGAFLVMRLLPSSLRTALKSGPWDVQATARLLDQIAGALGMAHRAGIVHRDIKPDNILLDEDSNAYLTDFGIAKDLSADERTQEGQIVGSPAYLTPEQIRGEGVTPTSDIYSLGLVIYEMLSGGKPYADSKTPAELMFKHLNEGLPPLSTRRDTLPAALNQVLQTATAKAPTERYASALRFADAFRAALPANGQDRNQPLPEALTERELDILALMVEGLSNKDIAARRYLSLSTVRWYVQQIYTKLDAHSRQQAIERAKNLKLVGQTTEEDSEMQKTSAIQSMPASPAPEAAKAVKSAKALTTEQRNRQRMLEKVRTFWVEGVLENSLHGAALIELGMKENPEAVERAWDIVLQQAEQPEQTLPHGTRIADVFDEMDGELLILGEPGSGKTTTLLELARDLLAEAEADERQPMPTVFNLSSWASTRKPIQDWLIDELNSKYQIPRKVGQAWVEADQILPLLDGLDEVKQDYRAACVEAINAWRQEHGFLPVVVCSRITDYEALSVRLRLRTAIVLQPLTLEQIDQSLAGAMQDLSGLRSALHKDKSLQSLLKTPLMLSIVTLTYRDIADKSIFTSGSPEARNAQIFDTYIAHALKRRGKNAPYSQEQTVRWLSWLAKKQQESGQSVFYIENMQPKQFLETRVQRFLFSSAFGTCLMLPAAPILRAIVDSPDFFVFLVVPWVSAILFVYLSFARRTRSEAGLRTASRLPFTLPGLLAGLGRGMVIGLLGSVLFVLSILLIARPGDFISNIIKYGVQNGRNAPYLLLILLQQFGISGAAFGVIYGALDAVTSRRPYLSESDIKVADTISWSGRAHLRSLLIGAISGLVIGLIAAIVVFMTVIASDQGYGIDAFPFLLTFYSIRTTALGVLVAVLFGGTVSREVDMRTRANQGIWRTARNAIRSGLIRTMFFVPACVLYLFLNHVDSGASAARTTLLASLSVAFAVAAIFGGTAVIKHLVMRFQLALTGKLPLNLARFLDYASDTILLRKVGGGYVYIHRMLLEHFAAMAPSLAFQKSKRKRVPGQAESASLSLSMPVIDLDTERAGDSPSDGEEKTLLGTDDASGKSARTAD